MCVSVFVCLSMFSFAKSESKCLKIVRKEKSSKHQKKASEKKRIFIFDEDYMPLTVGSIKMIEHLPNARRKNL